MESGNCSGIFRRGAAGAGAFVELDVEQSGLEQPDIEQPDLERPFKTPAVFFVAPLGAASAFFLMCGLPIDTWLRLGAWFVIGVGVYFCYGIRHSRAQQMQPG